MFYYDSSLFLEDSKAFLFNIDQTSANVDLNFLSAKENVTYVAFPSDTFKDINDLNLKLQ